MGLGEMMRHARRKALLVPAVALVVLGVPLAGCGSSGSSGSPGPAASSSQVAAGGTASAVTASSFASIVEPFDPGHPARAEPAPARCGGQSTAIEIERCYQAKTENVDAQIDIAQSARYSSAAPAARKTIVAQDSAWLAARAPVCAAAFNTGGTIDGISTALNLEITIKDGRVVESNFGDYRLLRIPDAPAVDVHIVESREAPTGFGEIALPPCAGAVANASFAATGKRIRRLPLRVS